MVKGGIYKGKEMEMDKREKRKPDKKENLTTAALGK